MKTSKYLNALKLDTDPHWINALSGSTPSFPAQLASLLRTDLELSESRDSRTLQELVALIKENTGQEHVALTLGASGAFFMTAHVLAERFRSVVIERPYYEPYLAVLVNLGLKVDFWDRSEDTQGDLAHLKKLASKKKFLLLSNPNFFAGYQLTPAQVHGLCRLFPVVVMDEVFCAQFSPENQLSSKSAWPGLIVINGLSKSLGLGSLRIGWAGGSAATVRKLEEFSLLLHTDLPAMPIALALNALKAAPTIVGEIKRASAANRAWVRQHVARENVHLSHSLEHGHFAAVARKSIRSTLGLRSELFGLRGHNRFRIDGDGKVLRSFFLGTDHAAT